MHELLSTGDFLWMTFAAILTFATFSFLYKDNPLYKIAEHLVVGVSAGYFVIILYYGSLQPQLIDRLADGKLWYLIPLFLGIIMWARFSRKFSWISRYPIAAYIGIGTGLAIPLEMQTKVTEQLHAMMVKFDWGNLLGNGILDYNNSITAMIIVLGSLATLIYFYFSKEHKGWFGGIATVGIWTLMLGFGASFGFTVMARISLLINRVQFLELWRVNSVGSKFQEGSGAYTAIYWIVLLAMLALLVIDLIRTKGKTEFDVE